MTTITKAAQQALEANGDRALLLELLSLYDQRAPLRERPELWERVRAALQDKAGEVHLGPLVQRNVFDAIRGAYDLGYNDARNARSVPGDSAPGYKGRDVEADHGGALFNTLVRRLRNAAQPAPVVPDRDVLTVNLLRHTSLTKTQARALIAHWLDGVVPDEALLKKADPVVPDGWDWADVVREKLARFMECAEDDDADGVDIGRNWLDALTVIGLLCRAQRSPALWEMTDAGFAMLAASQQKGGEHG